MGVRGPLPKRSGELLGHVSKERKARAGKLLVKGVVVAPPLPEETAPIAAQWYESLKQSGQSQFYEPSDWASALIICDAITKSARAKRFSSMSFAAIWSAMGDLLTTEGHRRRVKIEVERTTKKTEKDAGVTALNDYRKRLG